MSSKECKFCDMCGKQVTVYDSDGDPVHEGYEIKGNIEISHMKRTNCSRSSRPVESIRPADICSTECLNKLFFDLKQELAK